MAGLYDNNSRIARNSIYMTVRMVIVLGITLYTTRAVLQALGVEDFGIYNVVCGFVAMFVFLNTAMTNGIQRFYNFHLGRDGETGITSVYNAALRIQIIVALIVVVLTETVGLWYLNNKMVIPVNRLFAAQWIFQFSIVSFIAVILQAPYSAAIMAHERFDYYAIVGVLDAVLKLLIALVIPYLAWDRLILYGLLLLGVSILNFFLYFVYSKRHFDGLIFKRKTSRELFAPLLSFSGWNIFGALAGMFKEHGINLVLNLFFGPVVNAARGIASQVNGGVQSFVSNISISVRPQVVQSYAQGKLNRTMRLTYSISKLSCEIMYLLGYPICLEINYVLRLWLGNDIPDHTATFVIIILLTKIINNLNTAVSGVVHASGKMALYQISGGFFALLTIPASYFLLKMGLEPESVLWGCLVITSIAQIAALLILRGIVHFSLWDYVRKVIIPFVFVVLSSFWFPLIPKYFMSEGFVRFCSVTLASTFSSALFIYFIGMDKDEKTMIRSFIRKLVSKNNK